MADNRLALRELQARLAQRLDRARESGVVTGWLAVEIGQKGFLFPLTQSGEIFPVGQIQVVPYTQEWFMGVANLRGGLYGVVDARRFLFAQSSQVGGADPARLQSRLVALNPALDVNCVLLVDQLSGLRNVDSFVHEMATDGEKPAFFGAILVDEQGRHWQEIDLQKLASDPHFLTVTVSSAAETH